MRKKLFQLLVYGSAMASLTLLAGGCAKKQVDSGADITKEQEPVAEVIVDVGDSAGSEESISSSPVSADFGGAISEGRSNAPMLPIYFDFDKSNIREDQVSRIETNGAFLKDNMGANIIIQGNCDERGTQEYNMALGERRAQSARKYLTDLGVDAGRVMTISYGEEKPLVHGHDEYSWAQNRRDDFVFSR